MNVAMTNVDLRFKAKSAGIALWEIAEELGVTEVTICRRFRKELTPEQKKVYLDAMKSIAKKRFKNAEDVLSDNEYKSEQANL